MLGEMTPSPLPLTHGLALGSLGGPDGLLEGMEEFEAEAVFLGRPFNQLTRVEQHRPYPVAAL